MAMSARQIWEGCLTELSKVNAPSMLLQDFNYYLNKAVNQYINKKYNIYDVNQLSTDDLRVLKAEARLTPTKINTSNDGWNDWGAGAAKLYSGTYEVYLPTDYLHLLNCICVYKLNKRYKCYNQGDHVLFAAKRLTADSWSTVVNDYYNRPLPWRPYYYVHNVNKLAEAPTNPYDPATGKGTDFYTEVQTPTKYLTVYVVAYKKTSDTDWTNTDYNSTASESANAAYKWNTFTADKTDASYEYQTTTVVNPSNTGFPRTLKLTDFQSTNKDTREADAIEREAGIRYGNSNKVRCEIRFGHDDSVFELVGVAIDYIKAPQEIRLTQEQVDLIEDTSQILEYPDSVCHEIINELIHLVMEATADPRLLTHIPVTTSVANPAQQLTQPTATTARSAAKA